MKRDIQHFLGRRHFKFKGTDKPDTKRAISLSAIWRRSSLRWAVIPSAPALTASLAAAPDPENVLPERSEWLRRDRCSRQVLDNFQPLLRCFFFNPGKYPICALRDATEDHVYPRSHRNKRAMFYRPDHARVLTARAPDGIDHRSGAQGGHDVGEMPNVLNLDINNQVEEIGIPTGNFQIGNTAVVLGDDGRERTQTAGIVYNGNFHATHMGFLEMALAVPRNIDPAFRLIGIPLEQVAIDGMDRYPLAALNNTDDPVPWQRMATAGEMHRHAGDQALDGDGFRCFFLLALLLRARARETTFSTILLRLAPGNTASTTARPEKTPAPTFATRSFRIRLLENARSLVKGFLRIFVSRPKTLCRESDAPTRHIAFHAAV